MKRMVVLFLVVVACKGKAKEAAPGSASAAPPPAIDAAVDAPPPVDAAPAPPASSTRNGPWGLDATKKQTLADITGYVTKDDVATSRAGYDKAGFVARAADAKVGVFAHYAMEGQDRSITFYEAGFAEGTPGDTSYDEYEKAGLCVEGVCPGAPLADAEKLTIKRCTQYTVEMNWFFGCEVEGSPLVIVSSWDGAADHRQHGKPIAFKKLVARKQTILALAWGAWEPMGGCVSDCD